MIIQIPLIFEFFEFLILIMHFIKILKILKNYIVIYIFSVFCMFLIYILFLYNILYLNITFYKSLYIVLIYILYFIQESFDLQSLLLSDFLENCHIYIENQNQHFMNQQFFRLINFHIISKIIIVLNNFGNINKVFYNLYKLFFLVFNLKYFTFLKYN